MAVNKSGDPFNQTGMVMRAVEDVLPRSFVDALTNIADANLRQLAYVIDQHDLRAELGVIVALVQKGAELVETEPTEDERQEAKELAEEAAEEVAEALAKAAFWEKRANVLANGCSDVLEAIEDAKAHMSSAAQQRPEDPLGSDTPDGRYESLVGRFQFALDESKAGYDDARGAVRQLRALLASHEQHVEAFDD